MPATPQQVGERVKAARLDRGWNRRRLAVAAGVSKDVIYRLETGQIVPRQELVREVARALETPQEAFLAPPPATTVRPRPRLRVRQPQTVAEPVDLPVVVVQLLMSGRLGVVSAKELEQLIRFTRDQMFASDVKLLELEFLWRRACGAMHKPEFKKAVDLAFERIREELLESS